MVGSEGAGPSLHVLWAVPSPGGGRGGQEVTGGGLAGGVRPATGWGQGLWQSSGGWGAEGQQLESEEGPGHP